MYENVTMYGAVKEASIKYPRNKAIWYENKFISFKSFLKQVDSMAGVLQNTLHIKKDDVIILAQPNIPDTLIIFYALNKIGAITFFIHPLTPFDQLLDLINKSHAKYAIVFEQRVAKEIDKFKTIKDICLVTRIENHLPVAKKAIYHIFMNSKIRKKLGSSFTYIHSLKKSKKPVIESFDNMKCSVMLNSGSTTGDPKTICLNDKAFNVLGDQTCSFLACTPEFALNKGMISVLPSFHGFGLGMTMHVPLTNGFPSVLIPKFNGKNVAKALRKTNAFCICGVPTLYDALLNSEDFRKSKDLKQLHVCYCGGDSLTEKTLNNWNELMKEKGATCRLFEGFGLTEAIAVNCVNTYEHNKEGSIGYPIKGATFKIVDENRKDLGINQIGEIAIKSPIHMIEYFNDPEATKRAMPDVYIYTGDLGYIDEDGFIFFKQRVKRVIKVSGVGVFPTEVENFILNKFPTIKQCCAVEIPDEKLVHALKLFVAPKQEAGMDVAIIEKCREYLIRWAVPKEIEYLDELPKTPLGKIDFNKLTMQEKKKRELL